MKRKMSLVFTRSLGFLSQHLSTRALGLMYRLTSLRSVSQAGASPRSRSLPSVISETVHPGRMLVTVTASPISARNVSKNPIAACFAACAAEREECKMAKIREAGRFGVCLSEDCASGFDTGFGSYLPNGCVKNFPKFHVRRWHSEPAFESRSDASNLLPDRFCACVSWKTVMQLT
jgi:hypothetical protein